MMVRGSRAPAPVPGRALWRQARDEKVRAVIATQLVVERVLGPRGRKRFAVDGCHLLYVGDLHGLDADPRCRRHADSEAGLARGGVTVGRCR